MKNLPEHEAFKALENRLNNYTEQPDDDLWQKVAAALPRRKPVWAPWMNRFAGVVTVAALGWALWSGPAEVGGHGQAIIQPKSPSVAYVAPDNNMTESQIQSGNADSGDVLSQADQPELLEDVTSTNKKSTNSNRGSASSLPDAGSGLNSSVNASRALNQPPGSARSTSSHLNSPTGAHATASQIAAPSPASSIPSTLEGNRHSNLPLEKSASSTETKWSDAVADEFRRSTSQHGSSLDNPPPSADPRAITPANEIKSATALSTQDSRIKQIAGDSSRQKEISIKVSKADSAGAAVQETPYNRPKKKRAGISVYALFSPTLSFQTAAPSARDGVIIQKFNKPAILSGDRLGLALEVGVQGRLSKKFEYFAGLSVYHQSQTLQYTYQSIGEVVIENSADDLSYTVKPAAGEGSVSYNMLNVGGQAGVLYTLKEHRLSHKIGLALQYQKGMTHASTGEPYDNASSSYLNYQVLYRAEVALDDRLTFIVQPSVTRTWLVDEMLHTSFTLKQYRPGVSIGLSYRFTR